MFQQCWITTCNDNEKCARHRLDLLPWIHCCYSRRCISLMDAWSSEPKYKLVETFWLYIERQHSKQCLLYLCITFYSVKWICTIWWVFQLFAYALSWSNEKLFLVYVRRHWDMRQSFTRHFCLWFVIWFDWAHSLIKITFILFVNLCYAHSDHL